MVAGVGIWAALDQRPNRTKPLIRVGRYAALTGGLAGAGFILAPFVQASVGTQISAFLALLAPVVAGTALAVCAIGLC